MPQPFNQSCGNCRFMVLVEDHYSEDERPECHRLPPARYTESVQVDRLGTLDKTILNKAWCGWPSTRRDDWCGEWTTGQTEDK
jgi:hypothetical protein